MNPTLAEWLEADEATREVFMDWLLERIPPGYRDQRETDHTPNVIPRFVHEETGVLFYVMFGGTKVIGMDDRRWGLLLLDRVSEWLKVHDHYLDPIEPPPLARDTAAIEPACEVEVETALVAERPLVFGQLLKLGLAEGMLMESSGIAPRYVGALLAKLPRIGWRAPSEAEWEYAMRSPSSFDLRRKISSRNYQFETISLGAPRPELCRDDFMPTLEGYPKRGSRGDGHTVVRFGRQDFGAATWPDRQSLAAARGPISFRPWVSLRSG